MTRSLRAGPPLGLLCPRVVDGAWGLSGVPVSRALPPISRALSSRKAPPPKPSAWGMRSPHGDSRGTQTFSPEQPPYRVIGLLWPNLG